MQRAIPPGYRRFAMKSSAALFFLAVMVAFPVPSYGNRVMAIDCAAVTAEPARRVYFYDASADEMGVVELQKRLLGLGAYHVNVFPPSHVVCNLPETLPVSEVTRGTSISAFEEREMRQLRSDSAAPGIQWLRECYDLARRSVEPDEEAVRMMRELSVSGGLRDSVGALDPALLARSVADRAPADGAVFRRIDQNAEFMIGKIVVNMIIPESKYNMENWKESEKGQAIQGTIAGIIRYQELFPHAPMNFIIRTIEDVATYYEPSHTLFDNHENWIRDVMSGIGYNYANWDAPRVVDKFHRNVLAYFAADWIFTVFIIRAKNMIDYRILNTDFTTYAIRGGPYMILPFPTGPYSYYFEPSFITSLCVQHDVGHIFWGMDESEFSQGWSCENRCGYLDYQNANKIEEYILEYIPVNHCIGLCTRCIMDIPEWHWEREVCPYTAGQMGIVDWDENDVPDIFDLPPIAEFIGGPAETLVTDAYTVRCAVKSVAIPNRNYKQDSTYWIDYACPLKDVVMDLNGFGNLYLLPEDGKWDEVEEEVVIPLTDLPVGLTSIELYIRTTVGNKSPARVKQIFRAGLSYTLFTADCGNGGIELSWFMVGETFHAVFDLYRIETEGGISDTTLIAVGLQPSGAPEDQFLPFAYFDSDVTSAKTYWYFIRGTYALSIQGGPPQEFVTDSKAFKAMAIVPIPAGEMLSHATPNPFKTSTRLSVIVPKSYTGGSAQDPSPAGGNPTVASGLKREVPTELVVKVFDVAGRHIKTVLRESYFGTTVTIGWDATNDKNEPVPSGIYFLKASAGPVSQVRKVTVLR
jgi:hypothetical protein